MSETQMLTPLLNILKEKYTFNQDIEKTLNSEYEKLSDKDQKFLNDKIANLMDFHNKFTPERQNYPELTLQIHL